jgi:hypothetical protein
MKCKRCSATTTLRCGLCDAAYCNKDCQTKDWATHKLECGGKRRAGMSVAAFAELKRRHPDVFFDPRELLDVRDGLHLPFTMKAIKMALICYPALVFCRDDPGTDDYRYIPDDVKTVLASIKAAVAARKTDVEKEALFYTFFPETRPVIEAFRRA